MVESVKNAKNINDIQCKKIVGAKNSYRIRINDYRVTFILKVFADNTIIFQRVLPRQEVYRREYIQQLLEQEKQQE
jgi:mRNA-degrading endonuclease RelE of RelBE toxin-antitoxin system